MACGIEMGSITTHFADPPRPPDLFQRGAPRRVRLLAVLLSGTVTLIWTISVVLTRRTVFNAVLWLLPAWYALRRARSSALAP